MVSYEQRAPAAACQSAGYARAQCLEDVHAWTILQYTESLVRHCPGVGAAWLRLAGGYAFYAGPSPFTLALGVGMHGPVTESDIDQIEAFFRNRGVPAAFEMCPFTDSSLSDALRARGYRTSEITSVLCRELGQDAPALPVSTEIDLRWAGPAEIPLMVETVATCMFAAEPGPQRRANMAAIFSVPGSLNALAFVEGQLAGVAGGMLPPVGGVAPFFASCTLPSFRRRGVHSALLRFRMQRAHAEGASGVLVTAIPGSDSERNLQRNGFSVAYEKQTWVK